MFSQFLFLGGMRKPIDVVWTKFLIQETENRFESCLKEIYGLTELVNS